MIGWFGKASERPLAFFVYLRTVDKQSEREIGHNLQRESE